MSRPCEVAENDRDVYDKAKIEANRLRAENELYKMNTERLAVLQSRPDLLAEVDGVILRNRLHKAIMNMVIESVESGKVQVESIEDIETPPLSGVISVRISHLYMIYRETEDFKRKIERGRGRSPIEGTPSLLGIWRR